MSGGTRGRARLQKAVISSRQSTYKCHSLGSIKKTQVLWLYHIQVLLQQNYLLVGGQSVTSDISFFIIATTC